MISSERMSPLQKFASRFARITRLFGVHLHSLLVGRDCYWQPPVIDCLAVRSTLSKGSIVSSSLYGHQAMGVPPKRMKIIRGMCAGLLGRKSLGGLEATLDMFQHQCEDPRATIMGQHFQVIHKFFVSAKDEELQLLHDAWQASWNSLSYREHPWRTVRGPFAACQAYILELGGRAPQVSQWTFPEGVFHFLTLSGYHQVLELMRLKCRAARCTGIAATSSGQGCEEGLDWTVPIAMLKKSKGLQQSACLSVWQRGFEGSSCGCLPPLPEACYLLTCPP